MHFPSCSLLLHFHYTLKVSKEQTCIDWAPTDSLALTALGGQKLKLDPGLCSRGGGESRSVQDFRPN